ncbi:MAG: sodium:solute symporter, partial [Candidatus Eremiobacterales bacterium]
VQPKFSINFQLLGGAWMLQIFPAVVLGLYTRWFHSNALLAGWFAGMLTTAIMAYATNFAAVFSLSFLGTSIPGAILLYAFIVNLIVSVVFTWIFRAANVPAGGDLTATADYA